MHVGEPIHRRANSDFNPFGWNVGLIQTAVVACHLRGRHGELAEATGHLSGGSGHPVADVEVWNLAHDLAFARELRGVEEGGSTDAGAAGDRRLPEAVDAHADWGHDAKACDHCLSPH